jgi:Transposase DDE domain/Transposase domain (DUF772)
LAAEIEGDLLALKQNNRQPSEGPMLSSTFYQLSMVTVDPDAIGLAMDSFERGLPGVLRRVLTLDDFREFHPLAQGAPSCCPVRLTGMLLLQSRYDLADEELIARCWRDLGFRYALGLVGGEKPPKVSSLRRFRAWVREKKGVDWLFCLSLKLPKEDRLVDDAAQQVVDSTNTECRGAVIDTFNLIAVGIGQVVRAVARCLGTAPDALAETWGLSAYLARSIKGGAAIDWSSEEARNRLLTQEIRDADRLPALVKGLGVKLPKDIGEALDLVAKVARQDVEAREDGTFRIARGTTPGRTISITDPEASHGRKSSSLSITGYKTHVMGTIASQFVTGITVTDAATPDARPTPTLIERTERVGLKPEEALGDCAYGTGANRKACREAGVVIRTKLPSPSHKGFTKRDFKIDLDANAVTCPAGHTTTKFSLVKDPSGSGGRVQQFRFSAETCQACPLKEKCGSVTAGGRGRLVPLNINEPEIQEAQAYNATPEAKVTLRKRSAVERLISHLVRMGMRQARFFGMHMVEFQAHLTAAAYNFQRHMTLTAA